MRDVEGAVPYGLMWERIVYSRGGWFYDLGEDVLPVLCTYCYEISACCAIIVILESCVFSTRILRAVIHIIYLPLFADLRPEEDDYLSRDAEKVDLPEVYSAYDDREVDRREQGPHHKRDYRIVESAVMPHRVEHQPDDAGGRYCVREGEKMRVGIIQSDVEDDEQHRRYYPDQYDAH